MRAHASPYQEEEELDEDGQPARYVGLAGGGSVSDLSQIVREMNQAMLMGDETRNALPGVQAREEGQTPAGGAGPSSLGQPSVD